MFWMWSQQISKVIGLKGCPNRLGSKSRLHVELVCIVIGTPLRIFTTMAWRTFPCDPCSRHDVLPRGWRCLSANKGFLSAREFVRLCAPATRVAWKARVTAGWSQRKKPISIKRLLIVRPYAQCTRTTLKPRACLTSYFPVRSFEIVVLVIFSISFLTVCLFSVLNYTLLMLYIFKDFSFYWNLADDWSLLPRTQWKSGRQSTCLITTGRPL